jgi:transposase
MERRPYRSDLSDARWALIEPVLTQWRAARPGLGISQPVHDLREIVAASPAARSRGSRWVAERGGDRCAERRNVMQRKESEQGIDARRRSKAVSGTS